MSVQTFDPQKITIPELLGVLQGAIVPRPIALVSSVDKEGRVNLSPFSFFNMVSIHPPIMVFAPSRRVRNNTEKHTLENALAVPEVVINIVNFSMVEQASLSSCEFPKEVNEFTKAGFTAMPSSKVKPPRVGESPVAFECKVNQVIALGQEGGGGNMVVCEVLLAHVKDEVLSGGKIDQYKLDAVARMGGDYYCRANGDSLFTIPKPTTKIAIGIDQLPEDIRTSKVLSGNDLARLANVEKIPAVEKLSSLSDNQEYRHHYAKTLIAQGKIDEAWQVLLS
ncbi:MAG: flavin reductase family protein [Bacteroidetes bacterium]|nr:flavin reductase family protein [Bacteroidota bacterium]